MQLLIKHKILICVVFCVAVILVALSSLFILDKANADITKTEYDRDKETGAVMYDVKDSSSDNSYRIMTFTKPSSDGKYICKDWKKDGDDIKVINGTDDITIDYIEYHNKDSKEYITIDDEGKKTCYCRIYDAENPDDTYVYFNIGGSNYTHTVYLKSGINYNTIEFSPIYIGLKDQCWKTSAVMHKEEKNSKGGKSMLMDFKLPSKNKEYICTDWELAGDDISVVAEGNKTNRIDYIQYFNSGSNPYIEIDDETDSKVYCKIYDKNNADATAILFVLGGNDTTHKVNLVSGVDYNTIEFSDTDFGIVNRCNDSGAFMLPEQKNKKGEKSQIMRFTVPEDLSVGETRYLCTDWDIGGDEVEVPAVDGNSNFIDYIEVKKNQLDYTLEIDDEANAKCYCKIFNSCYPDKDPVMLVLGAYDDRGATVHKANISGSYYDSIEFSSYSLGIDDRCYETGAYAYEITDNIMGGKTRVIKFKMPPHEYKFNDKDDYGHPLTETNPGCLSQNINQDHDDPITKKAKEKEQEKKVDRYICTDWDFAGDSIGTPGDCIDYIKVHDWEEHGGESDRNTRRLEIKTSTSSNRRYGKIYNDMDPARTTRYFFLRYGYTTSHVWVSDIMNLNTIEFSDKCFGVDDCLETKASTHGIYKNSRGGVSLEMSFNLPSKTDSYICTDWELEDDYLTIPAGDDRWFEIDWIKLIITNSKSQLKINGWGNSHKSFCKIWDKNNPNSEKYFEIGSYDGDLYIDIDSDIDYNTIEFSSVPFF